MFKLQAIVYCLPIQSHPAEARSVKRVGHSPYGVLERIVGTVQTANFAYAVTSKS